MLFNIFASSSFVRGFNEDTASLKFKSASLGSLNSGSRKKHPSLLGLVLSIICSASFESCSLIAFSK